MTTVEWIALLAIAQTFVMMGAGFYVWSAGRRNVDLDGRFRLFKAEFESEWKDRLKEDRHELRTSLHEKMLQLHLEIDEDVDDVKRDVDELRARVDRAVIALRPKS